MGMDILILLNVHPDKTIVHPVRVSHRQLFVAPEHFIRNKTNDLILNLTPENVTQHSRIVTATHKGSSTPTKMSKIIGRQIH